MFSFHIKEFEIFDYRNGVKEKRGVKGKSNFS
jgi:hypothetical protein